jgi:hypothetical protein
MRDEEAFLLFGLPCLLLVGSILIPRARRVHEQKMKRLQVLQDALRHPSLDEVTRSELVRLLTEEHRQQVQPLTRWVRSWSHVGYVALLAASWLLMMGGAASWLVGRLSGWPSYSLQSSIFAAVAGFVLITLPIALREMLRRGGGHAPAGR